MEKNVLNTDLSGKVAAVTGAGGVLCSAFAKVLVRAGAKVALLDRNYENASRFAAEIVEEGGIAKAYACDVLDKDLCYAVADQVLADFGPCDILLNGAGGNNPRATTDKEYYEPGDIDGDTKSFFDL
ncbi:MAG: SDR family NAD(P)-dependent oxidoreductase, partial [Lachnospiraceae bacterium]|nr:SDR family NAD(P)-dependent oxidoreductase [Lachnospiraceae bacterium]